MQFREYLEPHSEVLAAQQFWNIIIRGCHSTAACVLCMLRFGQGVLERLRLPGASANPCHTNKINTSLLNNTRPHVPRRLLRNASERFCVLSFSAFLAESC